MEEVFIKRLKFNKKYYNFEPTVRTRSKITDVIDVSYLRNLKCQGWKMISHDCTLAIGLISVHFASTSFATVSGVCKKVLQRLRH